MVTSFVTSALATGALDGFLWTVVSTKRTVALMGPGRILTADSAGSDLGTRMTLCLPVE